MNFPANERNMNPLPESESGVNCWRLLKWIRYFDRHVLSITSEKFTGRTCTGLQLKSEFSVYFSAHLLAKSGACWERHGKGTRRSDLRLLRHVFFAVYNTKM